MRNDQSTFIKELGYMIDEFDELQDLRWSDLEYLAEYRELKMKKNDGLPIDQARLDLLEPRFKNKIVTSARWNKFQNALVGMQTFIKEEVEDYIRNMQDQVTIFTEAQKQYIVEFVDGKVRLINSTVADGIDTMEDKKNYFVTFVNAKIDEVQSIVQEFHTDTKRYYTTWKAIEGQIDYNVFMGSNESLPPEANVNIPPENVDLWISGVFQTPLEDYTILNNGLYDTIKLTPSAQSMIEAGTEVVAKWYKNVGKLYFKHAHSHSEGGYDEINVTKGMLDSNVTDEFKHIPHRGSIAPNPANKKSWIKTIPV